jgi:type II secretory pathway pseudopilin PulG
MKFINKQKNKGFTLVETMIAVFILVVALNGLLGLIASSLFSARYAKNDITANYLIQEALDYIRNDRDTVAFQRYGGGDWASFQTKYSNNGCFSGTGCYMEPSLNTISACSGAIGGGFGSIGCPVFKYDEAATNKDFYTYQNVGVNSNFKRQVTMVVNPTINNPDEIDIKVTVEWLNGSLVRSRSSRISLLNWQR